MRKGWKYGFGLLLLAVVAIWFAALSTPTKKNMRLIACDVGQGDAVLAIYGNSQILIDGGPGNKVIDCLAAHMPYYDRKIEVVVITHPQKDHFGGLIDVFRAYEVDLIVANSLDSGSPEYQVLKNIVGGTSGTIINPTDNTQINLEMMQFDVVWPSTEFLTGENAPIDANGLGLYTSKTNPNDFSIIGKLSLGEFDALLTGDIGPDVMAQVLATGEIGDIEYIKIPHHGSKNGLTQELLSAASPEVAVISVGKNPWGHPHEEVLNMLTGLGVEIKRTDLDGDIVVETDGESWWVR